MAKTILKKFIILIILVGICFINNINLVSYAGSKEDSDRMTAPEAGTIDATIKGAQNFVDRDPDATIEEGKLGNITGFLYNLFLGVGIIVAVIVGMILGIKYMTGSVEEKAEYKESLLAYAIGCVVIFGAFGIWKLVVNVFARV